VEKHTVVGVPLHTWLTKSFVNSSVSTLFVSSYFVWIRPSSFILASMCLSNSKRFLLRTEFWSCFRDWKIEIWLAFILCYDVIIEKHIWFDLVCENISNLESTVVFWQTFWLMTFYIQSSIEIIIFSSPSPESEKRLIKTSLIYKFHF